MTELHALDVPAPTVTTLTAPFWQAASAGRLVLQHCNACGRNIHYPRAICPACWSDDLSWQEAQGSGRLKSFSVVHKAGHPGWQPATPYIVGLVELDEGPTMLSFIHPPACDELKVGDAVHLTPTMISGRLLPVFSKMMIRDGAFYEHD